MELDPFLTFRNSSEALVADNGENPLHLHWPQCDFERRRLDCPCNETHQYLPHCYSKRTLVSATSTCSSSVFKWRAIVKKFYHALVEEDSLEGFSSSDLDVALTELLVGEAVVWGGRNEVHLGVYLVHDGLEVVLGVIAVARDASDIHENGWSELVKDEREREARLNRELQVFQSC